jgi:tetratricopeptide (TPR) repeat protein
MPNKNIWKTMTLLTTLILFFVTNCTTSIKLAVERPPKLNTAGIKRIAVMPFEANANYNRDMAQYATSVATNRIKELNYFTLVDPSEIERLKRNNQNIENYIDAQFVGRIVRINIYNDTSNGSYKNKDGTVVYYIDYITKVEIEFNYSLVLARDSRIIGPISKRSDKKSSSRESYPSSSELLRTLIDEQLRYLGRDIAPHTVIETRTFAEEKTKDKDLKAEMKNALTYVNAGNYKQALEAYLSIYDRYKSIAAAENASILYESFDEVQTAANLMQKAFNETGNPKAKNVLARLNKILQDKAILASDYSDTRDRTKKAADLASEEILNVLPKNAKVWIYNDSGSNPMAVGIVDNLTSDFIRKGINIVDRQNAALIEAEQNFNISGNVSDNDFISIGNAVGANTIVIIGITGAGATRRLQVRVLDIEKRIPIMQSDTSRKWHI